VCSPTEAALLAEVSRLESENRTLRAEAEQGWIPPDGQQLVRDEKAVDSRVNHFKGEHLPQHCVWPALRLTVVSRPDE